jgi:hypothetical protein
VDKQKDPLIVGDMFTGELYIFGEQTIEYVGPEDGPLNPFLDIEPSEDK